MAGAAGHAHSHGDSGGAHAHSHSHGGGNASGHSHAHGSNTGHNHAAGSSAGHSHSHAPANAAGHSHSCVNPKCPHKGAEAAKASSSHARLPPASADSLPAAPLTATQLASSSSAASSAAPAASSSSSSAAASAAAPTSLPAPVHSQTSYSPVPISNVSASTRHIYVPPCRPLLRPNFLAFPYSATPPLSCIHGFHTNLLFSHTDPVRILYADLGDVRHVLHALIDLHAKMKAWRKKVNSAGDKKAAQPPATAKPNADGLPLPPAPIGSASSAAAAAAAAAKNPNIGIEFHLNDPNPHILARSVLFLVSTYISSACMNVSQAIQSAASYGMPVPSAPYTLAQHVSTPGYSPSAAAAAALCLSSYRPWSPADHWCYLFFLYGSYQMPLQFLRRTAETLQMLVRLTGGRLLREDNLPSSGNGSASDASPSNASGGLDSSFFSQHPYTFFLHLPSIALALLLPIWRNWEDLCHRAIVHAEAAAAAPSSSPSPSPFHLPPVEQPMIPPADVAVAHPHDADVCAQLNHFYKHGCAALNAQSFGSGSKSRAEMDAARKAQQQQQTDTDSNVKDSSTSPLSAPISELFPPCTEEYFSVSGYLLNPTVFPCNFSSASFHFSSYAPAASVAAAAAASAAVASSAAPSAPVVAANLLAEVSQRYCFAREPFSPLLSRLSSGSTASSKEKDSKDKESSGGGLLASALEVMSKTSHALFWVVQFPQSAAGAAAAALSKPAAGSGSGADASKAPSKASLAPGSPRCPFVRLYFYPHDVYFHLHTYDFLWDRILVYHVPDYSGLQSLILMARPRMKNAEAILETAMNFPSCLPTIGGGGAASTALTTTTTGSNGSASSNASLPDLHKFCLLSLNANPKLLRNIFGWDMHIYSYPVPAGGSRATSVVRMQLCEYSLDISAPVGHISDGFRVLNDWLMTSIQPILLHDEFSTMHAASADSAVTAGGSSGAGGASSQQQLDLLRNSTPRSCCNLRTFCLLVGLMIKQGHLDQAISRQRIITLFATILTPKSAYQMDHLFTNLITHMGTNNTQPRKERGTERGATTVRVVPCFFSDRGPRLCFCARVSRPS